MTRNEQLAFCSICTKRKFDIDHGLICGLTNLKADFEHECGYFQFDPKEFKERSRNASYKLDEISAQKLENNYRTADLLVELQNVELKSEFRNSEKTGWFQLALGIGLTLYWIYLVIWDTNYRNNPWSLFIIGLGIVNMFFGYRALKDQTPKLVFDNAGISFRKMKIPWSQVVESHICECPSKHSNVFSLRICLYPSTIETIEIAELNGTAAQIGASFEQHRLNYWERRIKGA
jgi:hypothetical protein